MKGQNLAAILLYAAVLFHLVGMSGWFAPSMTQPLALTTLVLMLTALLAIRKKKRRVKRRPRKTPTEAATFLERAQEEEAGK